MKKLTLTVHIKSGSSKSFNDATVKVLMHPDNECLLVVSLESDEVLLGVPFDNILYWDRR